MRNRMNISAAAFATIVLSFSVCSAFDLYQNLPLLGSSMIELRAGSLALADFNGDGQVDVAMPGFHIGGIATSRPGLWHWSAAGRWPMAVAAGDFNGDGKIDLAVVLKGEGGVAILTNDGAGNFTRTAFYDTGRGTQVVAAADLNKDGRVDLVVANRLEGSIIRLINTGTGFRVEPAVLLPAIQPDGQSEVSSEPIALTIADINNDGWPDVVAACAGDDSVKILTNHFGLLNLTSTWPAGPYPVAVAAGDLNNDGLMDLVVADRENPQVTVLLQDAAGLFTPQEVFLVAPPVGAFTPPAEAVLVYANGDRFLDIRCSGYELYNDGTGRFSTPLGKPKYETVYTSLRDSQGLYLGTYGTGMYPGPAYINIEYIRDPGTVPGDISRDGYINVGDLQLFVAAWGSNPTKPNWNARADLNGDGFVNVGDLMLLVSNWGWGS